MHISPNAERFSPLVDHRKQNRRCLVPTHGKLDVWLNGFDYGAVELRSDGRYTHGSHTYAIRFNYPYRITNSYGLLSINLPLDGNDDGYPHAYTGTVSHGFAYVDDNTICDRFH